jgi:hypothetical protein
MKRNLLLLLSTVICSSFGLVLPANAHKEWVHQHMVKQAYQFLQNQIGDIPVLRYAIGPDYYGKGSDDRPFNSGYPISVGAWREDSDDPVYGYGFGSGGFTPSITHFWDADNPNENYESTPLNITGSSKAPNAWEKARIYLFCQDRNGGHDISIKYAEDGVTVRTYIITYTSLPEFYKGNYYLQAIADADGNYRVNYYQQRYDPVFARPIALQLLGRVAHLLGDMGTPAHAHSHLHPCPLGLPDYYENHMGNVYWANNAPYECEDDPGGSYRPYPAEAWNATTAAQQGGLLDGAYCQATPREQMRYLFYTVNQVADFFPSGVNNSSGPPVNNQIFVPGDNYLGQGTNAEIIARYAAVGNIPPSSIDHTVIGGQVYNLSIRAIGTLFQWFAYNAGLIDDLSNHRIEGNASTLLCNNDYVFLTPPAASQSLGFSGFTWSISPSTHASWFEFTDPQGQKNLILQAADPSYGSVVTVTLEYNRTDGCYARPVRLKREFWVGPPRVTLPQNYLNGEVCYNSLMSQYAEIEREDLVGNVDYSWESSEVTFPGNTSDRGVAFFTPGAPSIPFNIQVTASNTCGSSSFARGYQTVSSIDGQICIQPRPALSSKDKAADIDAELSVFPQPANEQVELSLKGTGWGAGVGNATYTLQDAMGKTVRYGSLDGTKALVSTQSLPPGLYLLRVQRQQIVKQHKLIIAH